MNRADILRLPEDIDEAGFVADRKTQDAVIRNFEAIGEASNNIRKHYPDFISRHAAIPLGPAYEMRNALAHGFKIDTYGVGHNPYRLSGFG